MILDLEPVQGPLRRFIGRILMQCFDHESFTFPFDRFIQKLQDRTGQDRTGQDRTGQDRTGQDRTGQDRTGQDTTRHGETRRDKTRRDETREGKG